MICNSEVHEETIIGLIRGELENGQEHSVKKHIEQCKECKQVYQTWSFILGSLNVEIKPSPDTKKKLMKKIKKEHNSIRIKKPTFIFISSCFAILMMLIGFVMNPANLHEATPQNTAFQVDQPRKQPFLVSDQTDVYEISQEWNDTVKGYAWINPYSNELMLLVDGLHPISINDYQAWIQTTDELKNAGLLKINGQKGQLYFQDGVIRHVKHIMVSKEPLGGSDMPTDPNPYVIKLSSN